MGGGSGTHQLHQGTLGGVRSAQVGLDWKAHSGTLGVRRPVGVVAAGGRTKEKGTILLQKCYRWWEGGMRGQSMEDF